jgi:hypothetical protein
MAHPVEFALSIGESTVWHDPEAASALIETLAGNLSRDATQPQWRFLIYLLALAD